jgi:topoisomerase-4 subunit B
MNIPWAMAKTVEVTIDKGKSVTDPRLWPGNSPGESGGCGEQDQYRRQIRQQGLPEKRGPERCGYQGRECPQPFFKVAAFREGKMKEAEFERGVLVRDHKEAKSTDDNGTLVTFTPDESIFKHFHFIPEYLEKQIWNYCFLNAGMRIIFNGKSYVSKNGLLDLLKASTNADEGLRYPIIHLKGEDIEVAITHNNDYGEDYHSFVNGQHTTQGGTHQAAFREAYVKVIRDFYKKDYEASDIRQSIVAAVSVRVVEPVFESQTKTKLGSLNVDEGGPSMRQFMQDFLSRNLDNFLHKNPSIADALKKRIEQSERERKDLAGHKKTGQRKSQEGQPAQ